MSELEAHLAGWAPEPVVQHWAVDGWRAAWLAAVLDDGLPAPGLGEELPPLWHWAQFLDPVPHRELGSDGHPRAGGFLPPIPDRTRMFAGGRWERHRPLRVGDDASVRTQLGNVRVTEGRSGEMVFVTQRTEVSQDGLLCVAEEQDLVYRSGRRRGAAPARPQPSAQESSATWGRRMTTDPVRLFRFSMVTGNAHRIHYDVPYAREVEGYPDLVVHGPLLVLSMAQLLRVEQPDAALSRLSYRLRRPVFVGDDVEVVGDPAGERQTVLGVRAADGELSAEAEATLEH